MTQRIVIIGGGAAGIDVLEFLLREQTERKKAEITLIKREHEGFFSSCGLPFALQGRYELNELVLFKPEFYRAKGVDFRTGTEVTGITVPGKYVRLATGEELPYDDLVIATGGRPVIPPIPGTTLEGVFTLWSREDGERLKAVLDAECAKNAVVIGGGMIGLQAAVAFARNGLKTTVVEQCPSLLPAILDADVASVVQNWLPNEVTFRLGRAVRALEGAGHVASVRVNEEAIAADLVLIAAGMRPAVDLARTAGLALGACGGIKVNHALRVKRVGSYLNNVYALGDCIEVIDAVTKRSRLSQLASTALIQARVVTSNLLGGTATYGGCLSPTVASIGGLQVGSVGVTTAYARSCGMNVKAGIAIKYTKARFFPTRKLIVAKLLFDASTERLIGAQLISEEGIAERINELTLAIKAGATALELIMRERCFEPSLTMVEDVIVDAAMKAHKRATTP
ncbi:MAG: FAD-dependent oxidoreductase [Methanomicrobia archaeon]|nr:FAD-dependent oxidoreductase [Methanomicrobia archaeon]